MSDELGLTPEEREQAMYETATDPMVENRHLRARVKWLRKALKEARDLLRTAAVYVETGDFYNGIWDYKEDDAEKFSGTLTEYFARCDKEEEP